MLRNTLCGRLCRGAAPFALAVGFAGVAGAQTTVDWLHIEQNPEIAAHMEELARAFEAENPGVTVAMQFLENEAFKAKLPTILQSDERPDIFYSWGGGVFHAQARAGVLGDMTAQMNDGWAETLSPAGVDAFTYDGVVHGAPMLVSQVVFWYNKDLFAQAGVDAEAIETWDDLLAAVQTLKDAGITPIAVGGADKWPLHFYWTHLAIRLGGKAGFEAATSGEGEGFQDEIFLQAGELFQQLTALEPFQDGYLAFTYPQAAGYFGDGNAAMHLMGNWDYNTARTNAADGAGLSDEQLGIFSFPQIPGGAGEPTDTLGGINGWLIASDASPEAVDFLRFYLSPENQTEMGKRGYFIPVAVGSSGEMTNPFFRQVADNIAASNYHQIFYDQMLGPSVGRVVNDVSADLAAGVISPEEAAELVQEAWEFEQ
ncbi:MAG: ABC transporter substrate-binding protein [Alphaproteobacteria bacterium]